MHASVATPPPRSSFPQLKEATARLTAALDGRYNIQRELGAGGMATVYLAQDLKHDRHHAVRWLACRPPPWHAGQSGARRRGLAAHQSVLTRSVIVPYTRRMVDPPRLKFLSPSGATYGAPRVQQELRAAGLPTSTKRVARLMRADGLVARPRRRRRVVTTNSNHGEPIAPNRLARAFDINGVGVNRVWVGDIAYVPTREGFLYLATVLDLGSRRCVGWAMRDTRDVDLVTSALRMARDARQPAPGLIFHSDRGGQYASAAYRTALTAHGMLASMSGNGDCYDNAVAESFFATLEFELIMQHDWHTRAEARRAIFRYIETWYNRKRRHSTLGYISPAEYEAQLQLAA